MTGDFNIRDSLWDPSFHFHSSISDNLIMIADSFDLVLFSPTNPCSTRYSEKLILVSKSEQETVFINDVISNFKMLDTSNIVDVVKLECIVNQLRSIID